jgi:hypothetical protein
MVERPLNLILLILVVAASLRAQAPGKGVKEPTGSIAGRVRGIRIGTQPGRLLSTHRSYKHLHRGCSCRSLWHHRVWRVERFPL